jgi:hypothetical protein
MKGLAIVLATLMLLLSAVALAEAQCGPGGCPPGYSGYYAGGWGGGYGHYGGGGWGGYYAMPARAVYVARPMYQAYGSAGGYAGQYGGSAGGVSGYSYGSAGGTSYGSAGGGTFGYW